MAEAGSGLAASDPDGVRSRVLACWDAFVGTAVGLDLRRPSRIPGWSAHDVCVHLGRWDDAEPLGRLLASARAGGTGQSPDVDADNAEVLAAHRDASREEVLAALRHSREGVAAFFDSPDANRLALAPVMTVLGTLPLLSIVHAGCYELAVHLLDLVPAGAPEPAAEVLHAGLGALLDVTAALALRVGIAATVGAQTPEGGWRCSIAAGGWTTVPVPPGPVPGCAILGAAADILDVSAGRAAAPALIAARRLRVQDMRTFLTLAPLVEAVPGLPGGAPLRAAARTLGAAAAVAGRLPRLLRRPG